VAAVRAILSTLHDLTHRKAGWRGAAPPAVGEPASCPWEGAYAHAGPEPLLEDLLRDPLVLRLMRADHLDLVQVRRTLGLRRRPVVL
jgi:hypothetical protein